MGIRVDGLDTLSQTIPAGALGATNGKIAFYYTPRHNAADAVKFGVTGNNPYIFMARYINTSNYIVMRWALANTITCGFNDNGGEHTSNWDATGAIVAGTKYLIEVEWNPAQMTFSVDGAVKITIVEPVSFGTVPTVFYCGTTNSGDRTGDAVFS